MAKDLAQAIGYIYIDSGAMYRAVTLYSIENGLINEKGINTDKLKKDMNNIHISFFRNQQTQQPEIILNGKNVENLIRDMRVSSAVSPIATLDFVRKAMVTQQQKMGQEKGIVMDGRDIGTTVFPNAELKIFVTASPEIRAERRYKELKEKGKDVSLEEILNNVKERDCIDQKRSISPLRRADDAILLDNSYMTIKEQKQWLMEQYSKIINS